MSKATNDSRYDTGPGALRERMEAHLGVQTPWEPTATQVEFFGLGHTRSGTLRVSVECVDWAGHPLFPRMARLYNVSMTLHCYDLNKEWIGCFDFEEVRDCTWTESLQAVRDVVAVVRNVFRIKPLILTQNGGYSDRICREISATDPSLDPRGQDVRE